jgi:hypothetical protein
MESETARFKELIELGNQRFAQPFELERGGVVYVPRTVPF